MKPTVGRIVHYYPEAECRSGNCPEFFAGIVTSVEDEDVGIVNLATFGKSSVYFNTGVHPYDSSQPHLGGWCWPPREDARRP